MRIYQLIFNASELRISCGCRKVYITYRLLKLNPVEFCTTVTIENVNSISINTSVFRNHSQPITQSSSASLYNVHRIKWKSARSYFV